MIVTGFGSWYNHQGHDLTVEQSVTVALGDVDLAGYDIDAIARAWRDAINEALPDTVKLSGDEFYGPADPAEQDWDGDLDITELIEGVDFWAIVQRHELWTIDRVAEELEYTSKTAAGTARKKLSAWGVKAVLHRPNEESGRVQAYYRSGDVMDARAAHPERQKRAEKADA